ncbi:MAG: alcohol dehydrogenase [Cyclobacteriaceae bacterium]|nr:MAG: alcohol dehydrogenase [Cyclobacteriaceae bacterium]
MKAWLLDGIHNLRLEKQPLRKANVQERMPQKGEVLVRISCCGVCHTELDEIEGRTPPARYPVIPGHQIVGHVEEAGSDVKLPAGQRVGIAWIYSACGTCAFCLSGSENLCTGFRATGRDVNGGYADYITVPAAYTYSIPDYLTDAEAAPLLCAGAIGYRSVKLSQIETHGSVLGLAGFGASNHLVLQLVRNMLPHVMVWVFARSKAEQELALELGATWAGDYRLTPPEPADAIIDTTPAWLPVLTALQHLKPGGRLIINAIRKESDDANSLNNLDYARHLWMEKEVKSVANITAADVREFLNRAALCKLRPVVQEYAMDEANRALWEAKNQPARGARVLVNTL